MIHFNSPYTKSEAHRIWNEWKKENNTFYKDILVSCETCGNTDALHIHHINGDKTDNNIFNLHCLCRVCHWEQHHHFIQVTYKPEDIDISIPKEDVFNINDLEWKNGRWFNKKTHSYAV